MEKYKKVKCLECGKDFYRISNTHLWKHHSMTIETYKEKYPEAEIESKELALARVNHLRNKNYEQIYGKLKSLDEKEKRGITNKIAWNSNPERKEIASILFSHPPTKEQKIKNSESHKRDWTQYRNKALLEKGEECERCGSTENLVVHHIDYYNLKNELGHHETTNLMVLCKKCHAKLHNEQKVGKFVGINKIEKASALMLEGLRDEFGLDISDVNFKDTPKRIARAYAEIFEGINCKEELKEILNTSFPTDYEGMVIEGPIECFSMCPHHFLPVLYKVYVGYIPKKGGLGLSKLPRLVELLGKAPKLQEQYTYEIIDTLEKTIKPAGAMVVVEGQHLCMQMRGIKKPGCGTRTSSCSGFFKTNMNTRMEFMDFVNKVNKHD